MLPEEITTVRRPKPEFDTPEDVRRICNAASERLEDLGVEVSIAAVVIQKFLQRIPDSSLGLSSRIRAHLVVRSLHAAARLLDNASAHSAGTYYALLKYFAKQMGEE
jgi:hypothetical protein